MNNTITNNIKEMRLYRKMKVEWFAKKCKVEPSVVRQWESGELIPTSQELYRIARALNVGMEFFFEEISDPNDEFTYPSPCWDDISSVMLYFTEIQVVNVARRVLLWRLIKEGIARYKLNQLDTPRYTVKYTTQKQREHIMFYFNELLGDEYFEILEGYVKGENELKLLRDEICKTDKDRMEIIIRDKKCETDTWKVYKQCIEYLSNALFNEFIDLRYAFVVVDKLSEHLEDKHEDANDIVLQFVHDELKAACEKNDVDNVRKIYTFLKKYGDALWSQLLEEDKIQSSVV